MLRLQSAEMHVNLGLWFKFDWCIWFVCLFVSAEFPICWSNQVQRFWEIKETNYVRRSIKMQAVGWLNFHKTIQNKKKTFTKQEHFVSRIEKCPFVLSFAKSNSSIFSHSLSLSCINWYSNKPFFCFENIKHFISRLCTQSQCHHADMNIFRQFSLNCHELLWIPSRFHSIPGSFLAGDTRMQEMCPKTLVRLMFTTTGLLFYFVHKLNKIKQISLIITVYTEQLIFISPLDLKSAGSSPIRNSETHFLFSRVLKAILFAMSRRIFRPNF